MTAKHVEGAGMPRLAIPLLLVAFAVGLAHRALTGWEAPLWLDEVFTGTIAIQPSFAGLIRDCLNELGGPVYYALIWSWEKLFGSSNLSLRLPSLIFSVVAPLLILRYGHKDRGVRLFWAALTALWLPGFYFAAEARPYALLFLLACGQVILFRRMLDVPSRSRALAWASLSAILALTHYHSLVLTGLQGLAFLALRRKAAFATWPAALIFVPMFAWMYLHLPLHIRFADPQIAWQPVLSVGSVKAVPDLLFGLGRTSVLLCLLIGCTIAFDLFRAIRRGERLSYARYDVVAAGLSLTAIAIVFGMGLLRPSFSPRYLIPFIPGVLFGVAIWLSVWGKRWSVLPPIVFFPFVLFAAKSLVDHLRDPKIDPRWNFTWQQASEDIRAAGANRVLFLWDSPTAAAGEITMMNRVSGFFYDRDRAPMAREAIRIPYRSGVDPNVALLQKARPGDAILWAYDSYVPNTLAIRYPPRISVMDPNWRCRNYGRRTVTMLACIKGR